MDANAQRELYEIKQELRSIINEMRNISSGIRNDFSGIGSERCSAAIDRVIDQYTYVQNRLNNIDTSAVTEEYAASHGGAGGGGGVSGW